jgi:hypothetical protein
VVAVDERDAYSADKMAGNELVGRRSMTVSDVAVDYRIVADRGEVGVLLASAWMLAVVETEYLAEPQALVQHSACAAARGADLQVGAGGAAFLEVEAERRELVGALLETEASLKAIILAKDCEAVGAHRPDLVLQIAELGMPCVDGADALARFQRPPRDALESAPSRIGQDLGRGHVPTP